MATLPRVKLNDFLEAGTRQVWLVYPDTRQVTVYLADGSATTYAVGQTVTPGDLLPGFSLDIADIFEA